MWRSRMFWQLFGSYGGLILASLGVLGYVVAGQVERNELAEVEDHLRSEALLLRELLGGPGPENAGLVARINDLATDQAPRVTLIARDGAIIADTARDPARSDNHADRPEVVAALKDGYGKAVRHSATVGQELMYVAVRNDTTDARAAVIRVALPVAGVQDHVGQLRQLVWLAVLLTATLALALAFWLAGGLMRPLQGLTQGAERIAAGRYGHRVYVDGANEVAALSRAFNYMSERLADQFAQLEEDRQQLRAVLSSMVEGVVAIDAEQRILFANDRACQLLEFPLQAALGRRLWEVVRQRPLQEVLRSAMTDGEVRGRELTWSGPGARSLAVHVARLPGEPARGAVLVFHDTTELRRLERLRQEFVANVSHELKTPLAIIQACVETLIDGAVDDPHHRGPFLDRIADQAHRLHNLILDLLQLSRIESEAVAFTKEALDIDTIVRDCLDRHHTLAEGKNQALEPVAPGAKVRAWADEEAVQQILDNLVNNALKYTPPGGRVQVRWDRRGDEVQIEVEDTGIGIPQADLPRIFERFYRVDKARSRELGGTGLGLSIVKHLAQAMQGTVRAESTVDRGSTFVVTLPAVEGR